MRTIILTLLIGFFTTIVFSQTKETIVNYDMDKQEFEDQIPFDETFKIRFKATKDISTLKIKYKIEHDSANAKEKKKYYFQYDNKHVDTVTGYISSEIKNISSKSFLSGTLGPIHPNTTYIFEFYAYEKINPNDETADSIKNEVKAYLNKLYVSSDSIPKPDVVTAKFNRILDTHINNAISDKNGKIISVEDFFSKELSTFSTSLNESDIKISTAKGNYVNSGKNLTTYFQDNDFKISFCKLIGDLDSKKINNPILLTEPINVLLEDLKSISLNEMLDFFKLDCNRDFAYTSSILNGKTKFNSKLGLETLTKNKECENIESLRLLISTFDLMNKLKKKPNNSNYFQQLIDESITTEINKMIDEATTIATYRNEIVEINTEFPNILINKYTQTTFITDYSPIPDVETKATPYINLDLGVLYASNLNDLFALQTVNFHLRPVNRNARFSKLKGSDKFFKQVCLQIGLAQRLGPSKDSFSTFLTGDLGTPYAGLGFRLNRIVRISGGIILYQEKNSNPIITDKVTKGSFSFSITINSALSSALGVIGTIFKGTNP